MRDKAKKFVEYVAQYEAVLRDLEEQLDLEAIRTRRQSARALRQRFGLVAAFGGFDASERAKFDEIAASLGVSVQTEYLKMFE